MSTLRMNIEEVRNLSQQLKYTAAEMDQLGNSIKTDLARLNWAWQGPEAGRFRSDLKRWLRDYQGLAEILELLANSVRREADEWEQVDHRNVFEPRWFNLPWQVLDWIKGINWPDIHLPRLPWLFPFFPLLPWSPFLPGLLPDITWPPKMNIRLPEFTLPDWFRNGQDVKNIGSGAVGQVEPVPDLNDDSTPFVEPAPDIKDNSTSIVESVLLSENATTGKSKCFQFVKDQRKHLGLTMPSGMCGSTGAGLYSGEYTGDGKFTDTSGREYSYGQEPRVGSIMVESPANSPIKEIVHGHLSIVNEVHKDSLGKVERFVVSETSWGEKPVHSETFVWNTDQEKYISETGRVYDSFVY